jgi:hypothetical protein
VRRWRLSFAVLAIVAFGSSVGPSGADEKNKDKTKAKAKPPARSYSDEDLKKYKEPATEGGVGSQTGSSDESNVDEPVPGQRRSREHGGTQVLPPVRPRQGNPEPEPIEPKAAEEPSSPEEASWKARASEARRPLKEAQTRIQGIEAEIADQRDKLNPMSTKYLLGGNSTAGPEAIYEVEEQLRGLDAQLVEARSAAVVAEQSWQRFLDEARAAGASPAWLNP